MNFISTLFGYPLGWIMYALYYITENYVLSLFLFTVVARLIMIPFTVKQQKSSVKMAIIKPQLDELQKKYSNNKEKLNEEMMKLYQQEGYNPMSGCIPLLINFPILFGLIDVIYKPMTHILRISSELIEAGTAVIAENPVLFELAENINSNQLARSMQLTVIKGVKEMPEMFLSALGPEVVERIENFNLFFLGMDLTLTPSWSMLRTIFTAFNMVILIPILAGVTSFITSKVTMKNTPGSMEGTAGASMKSMMYTMPLLSAFIAFSVPAGVGLYWIFSNVLTMAQTMIMNRIYNPKELAEKARVEAEERREKERLARIEAKKNDPNKGLSQKELNRRKLAEARQRYAEKYGDEYVEVTDKDLI